MFSRRIVCFAPLLFATCFIADSGRDVRADILPTSNIPNVTQVGSGQWRYTWSVQVSNSQQVNFNDFFTLYDVAGYVSGSALAPTDWVASVQNTGITPTGVTPIDSATVPNVTFTWCGPNSLIGPQILGNFSIVSIYPNPVIGSRNFAGRGTQQNTGLPNANLTNVATPSATPEPGSVILMGLGLCGAARLRRRKKVQTTG
jgi:hypothetical protein